MRATPSILLAVLAAALVFTTALPSSPAEKPEILPLNQVKPGMKGVVYTILAGETIEAIDLEVVGVMPNLLGPKQHIILVLLKGPKAEYTGVVAGMSGSPVYIEGKLAGALSLRFGIFTKEPLAGVTPIENMLEADQPPPSTQRPASTPTLPVGAVPDAPSAERAGAKIPADESPTASLAMASRYPLPAEFVERAIGVSDALAGHIGPGPGAYLAPIETPLLFSGFHQAVLQRFADQFTAFGMVTAPGGTVEPRPDDAQIKPGDMVGLVFIQGDLSLQAGCTVTAVIGDRVFICGHALFLPGPVELPLARGHVLTTMVSSLASVKIMNAGGTIGTVTQDRTTAVMGRLGPLPRLIPVELTIAAPNQEKQFRFEVIEHPKLTPLLVAIATFNGLVANNAYSEGMTFQLTGGIQLQGHSTVNLENMFAPTDQLIPDGFFVAINVQSLFTRIFTNPYERAQVEKIALRVASLPERRWAAIESAWSEKSEVSPGEPINVKVLLRPYRGAPFIREVPITIPAQVPKGNLRILVSDSETLNRMSRFFSFGPQARLPGLEQLIALLNRERRNNRLYVTLLQPTPTLLVEDKELPNAPISQINVLDNRRSPGSSLLLGESNAGEWSVPMNQVITGQQILSVTVR